MSSINQILNSALMETVETVEEGKTWDAVKDKVGEIGGGNMTSNSKNTSKTREERGLDDQPMSKVAPTQSNTDDDKDKPAHASGAPSPGSIDWATAGKYGGAGLAALGAGLGAVALAKKLRSKKTAVTAVKAKK